MISRALSPIRSPLLNLTRGLCSSWSSVFADRTAHNMTTRHTPNDTEESQVYVNAKKYARPSTVTWSERLHNSVSFIGTVEFPPKQYATSRSDNFGCHATLSVKASPDSSRSFRILLEMWDELAKRAFQHLKSNDYIYVSGQLGSYRKAALGGTETMYYKVRVNELNYVQVDSEKNSKVVAKSESNKGESSVDRYTRRLQLWQVFFANPNEWYDNRKSKKTPKHPDFKHKSTNEALWLCLDDPPWVRKQLELLDSRLPGGSGESVNSGIVPSSWVSKETLAVLDPTERRIND